MLQTLFSNFPKNIIFWKSPIISTLVSFPKSGRTWLRVILEDIGVYIEATHDESDHKKQIPWSQLTPCRSEYRKKRVIFLYRNPMDTVVSGYFQATRRLGNFEGDISSFIRDPRHGIEKILHFNTAWFQQQRCQDFLLVSYEAMKADDLRSVEAILDFLQVQISAVKLEETVKNARFDSLKTRESEGSLTESFGSAMQPGDAADPDSYKVRKGVVGGYHEYLSKADISYCKSVLEAYNYNVLRDSAEEKYGIEARNSDDF